MNQHVFFSRDRGADPMFTYRSRPIACYGMADTLAEARADFHEALALTLDEDEPEPTVVEHLERPHPDGFWVRIRLDGRARERDYAARVLVHAWRSEPAHEGHPSTILQRSRTDIGEPIVIICLPEDSIRSVVDEFGKGESCAVAISSANLVEGYDATWIAGIALGDVGSAAYPVSSLNEQGLTLDSTMGDLMQRTIAARPNDIAAPTLIVA